MNSRLPRGSDDSGAIAIMVSLLAVVFVLLVAFTVDFGVAYAQRRAISTGTDSAALAVARAYQQQSAANPAKTCAQLIASPSVTAQTIAQGAVTANAPSGTALNPVSVTCVSPSTGQPVNLPTTPAVIAVTASAQRTVPSIFGGIAGISAYHVDRTSTVVVGPAGAVSGLRPFGVCQNDADALISGGVNSYRLITDSNSGTTCGAAAGNWGTLTLPGITNNGNGQPSVCGNNLRSMILYGDCTPIEVAPGQTSLPISGNPGFPSGNSIDTEMNAIIGLPIVLPVYNGLTGNGANAKYATNGFLTVRMCGWWSGKNSSGTTPTGAGVNCYNTNPQYNPTTLSPSTDYLQLQYLSFVPLAEVSTICGLGANTDASCGTRPTAIQLVK